MVHKVEPKQKSEFQHLEDENGICSMDFDGALWKYGAGIGIWAHNPFHQQNKVPTNVRLWSYKLAFDCTNNEAKYEALLIGLNILKKLGARRIVVYGDSKIVIKQVKGEYQANHLWMRQYKNDVLKILKIFQECILKWCQGIKISW